MECRSGEGGKGTCGYFSAFPAGHLSQSALIHGRHLISSSLSFFSAGTTSAITSISPGIAGRVNSTPPLRALAVPKLYIPHHLSKESGGEIYAASCVSRRTRQFSLHIYGMEIVGLVLYFLPNALMTIIVLSLLACFFFCLRRISIHGTEGTQDQFLLFLFSFFFRPRRIPQLQSRYLGAQVMERRIKFATGCLK